MVSARLRSSRAEVVSPAQRAIRTREAERKFDAPDYQAALGEFYGKYVWRHPVQADLDSLMSTVNEAIYNYMQGPSEFTITGTLKRYDGTALLRKVKVPTLLAWGGQDLTMPPDCARRYQQLIPRSRIILSPGGSHDWIIARPAQFAAAVEAFLSDPSCNGQPSWGHARIPSRPPITLLG